MIPTIKGIFVNSHIKKVREYKGEEGVREVEKRFGSSVSFGNFQDIPVKEEVRLIGIVLEVILGHDIPEPQLTYEAGRLHFQNFVTTPFGRIIFSQFRKNFKLLMLNSPSIGGHVFKGVKFSAEDTGEKSVKVVMENNDYPIGHFQGLFQEWLEFSGLEGSVLARETAPNRFEYYIEWK